MNNSISNTGKGTEFEIGIYSKIPKELQIKSSAESLINKLDYKPDRRKFQRNSIAIDSPPNHREIILSDPNLKLLPKGKIINRSREGLLCVFKKVQIMKNHKLQTPLGLYKVVWVSNYDIDNKSFIKTGLEIVRDSDQ